MESQLIKFNLKEQTTDNDSDFVKGCKVTCSDSVMHLGYTLYSYPNQDDLQSVVNNYYRQFNAFQGKFQCVPPEVTSYMLLKARP